jgi:dCMP deaminase
MHKWDNRYLNLAKFISQWSKDPSTQCGAVLVGTNNHVVSIGYNGFPSYIQDTNERLQHRETKLAMTIHAERNALIFAKQDLRGCSLYTFPLQCCSECAAMIIQAGIDRHISINNVPDRWKTSFDLANQMFNEANVQTTYYERTEL